MDIHLLWYANLPSSLFALQDESELEAYMIRTLKSVANSNGGKLPPALQSAQKQTTSPQKVC